MAKKIVENQQLMSAAREAINDNFTELYDQVGTGGSSGGATSSTLSYKGAFASGTNYVLNDVVTFNGKSYVATSSTPGVIDPEGYGASAYENDGTVLDNEWTIRSGSSLNLIDDKLYVTGTPNVASAYVNRFITVVPGTRYYVTADVDSTNGPGLLVIDYQAGSWGAGSNTHEADHNFFEASGKISGYITPTGNSIYFGIRPGDSSYSTGSFYNIRVAATYPVEMVNPWSLLAGEIVMDGEIVGGTTGGSSIVTGNYTGNGEDPQTIELGFRPAVVHIQCTSAPYYGNQTQIDGMGSPNKYYYTSQSSGTGSQALGNLIEITDTGFKVIGAVNNSGLNHSGSNYSYYAIPESSSSSGGSSSTGGSSNFYGANIFLTQGTLAIKSQTSDFIESITMVGNTNNYDITFKDGIFTEPPIMVSSAVNTSDGYLEGVLVKSDASSGDLYASGKKMTIRWELTSSVRSYMTTAIAGVGANLVFMKTGADFDAGSSSGGSSGGGSSLSGGIGSAQAIKDVSNFAVDLPDALYVDSAVVGLSIAYLNHISSSHVVYRVTNTNSNVYLTFNNVPSGTLYASTNVDADAWSTDTSIQGYIDAGKAIYTGGSSSNGSSTFAALTDTPTELTADKYLKVNTEGTALELVDAPVGSGGGSGEGANTAEIQAHQGLFEGVVPFAISALTSNTAGRKILYLDHYGAGGGSEDYFLYSNHLDSSRFAVYFKTNTVTGEWLTSSTITKEGDGSLASYIANGHAFYFGGGSSSSGGSPTNNVVSAIIEADGTITSSSDDWIESIAVGNGYMTINFVSNYFTQTPSIATSIDHQDGASHMNIEHQALTKDTVQIIQRGLADPNYTTLGQFTIMAQHQDRISGGSSSDAIKTWGVFNGQDAIDTEMTLKAGANVASVLKKSSGVYKVTMTNPMPSEHYSVSVDCNPWGTSGGYGGVMYEYSGDTSKNPTTTTFYIDCRSGDNQQVSPNRVTFHVVC